VQQRPAKKLETGDHLTYEHALRCLCQMCGRLLDWECPDGVSYTETECCGLLYRLQPWTVKVRVDDVSSRPILPKMEGSEYPDPETVLTLHFEDDEPGRKRRDTISGQVAKLDTNLEPRVDLHTESVDEPPSLGGPDLDRGDDPR
jgi:hypothetical protein